MREGVTALLLALVCMHSAMCAVADQSRTHKSSSDAAVPQQLNPGPAVAETKGELLQTPPLDPRFVDETVEAKTTENGTDNDWADSTGSEEVETNDCSSATSEEDCHSALSSCSWKPITRNCVSAKAGGNDDNRNVFRHGSGISLKPSDYSVQTCSEKCAIVAMGEDKPGAVELMKAKGWDYSTLKKLILAQCDCKEHYFSMMDSLILMMMDVF